MTEFPSTVHPPTVQTKYIYKIGNKGCHLALEMGKMRAFLAAMASMCTNLSIYFGIYVSM